MLDFSFQVDELEEGDVASSSTTKEEVDNDAKFTDKSKMNETISHLFHADLVYDGSVFYLHQPFIDSRVKGHR